MLGPTIPKVSPNWKYVSIDIETLGLDENYCDTIEFGAILDDLVTPLDKLPRFHCYLTNEKDRYRGEAYAMQMHQKILERIAKRTEGYTYMPTDILDECFKDWLTAQDVFGEIVIAGKNFGTFDLKFLKKIGFGTETKFHRRIIDPGSMFYNPLTDKCPPNLEECLTRAGVKKSVSHTAVEDALDVIQCIRYKADVINDPNT